MPNRREFVRQLAGLAALAQGSTAGRRVVRIGGRPVPVIDVHAHCVVDSVAQAVAGTAFAANAEVPEAQRLGPARLTAMDRQGVDYQVLSINGFWWYGVTDRDLAGRIVRAQNESLSAWCRQHPDRFRAFASTSPQFPDLAADQLADAVNRLGLRGAAIGGHVNGESFSDPRFDPFWGAAESLGVIVFVHPAGAGHIIRDGAFDVRGDLTNIIGNPLETTYFLSRMIFDGTLDRFPRVKICAAHGGGYLPSYLGRTDVACEVRPNAKCANRLKPREYLRRQVFADTMVFSDEGLRHLVAEMGAGQLVYGTDVPYTWPAPVDQILDASFLGDADKAAILGGNLRALLAI